MPNLVVQALSVDKDAPDHIQHMATDINAIAGELNRMTNELTTTVNNLNTTLNTLAPLASPTFTGDPKAPTPVTTDNDTSVATTAMVQAAISSRANRGLFAVNRNGVNQTGMTTGANNKIQFTNKIVDTDNWFDNVTNFRYTPLLAGYYLIGVGVLTGSTTANETTIASIFKNGSVANSGIYINTSGGNIFAQSGSNVTGIVSCNGSTDFIEGFFYAPAGMTALSGLAQNTYMWGFRIGGS